MVRVAVVGAGILGLSTAVCVQEKLAGAQVTVYADKFTVDTTSDGSGGVFLPAGRSHFGDERLTREICRLSWQHFSALEASEDAGAAGIVRLSGHQLYFTANYGDPLPTLPLVCEFATHRKCSEEELRSVMPQHACSGFFTTTFIIENRLYLPYLTDRLEKRGGRLVKRKLVSLNELFPDHDVVINCSGLGSRHLCGDADVRPARGQVVRVRAPYVKRFVHAEQLDAPGVQPSAAAAKKLIYILPHTESIVLGGTYEVDDDCTAADEKTSQKIVERCSTVMPTLKHAPKLKDWVGLRPARYPVRLERDLTHHGSRLVALVHNYGHGGNGVAFSWGSAEVACRLALESVEAAKLVATSSPKARL